MSDFLLANHRAGTIYNPVNGDRVQFNKLPADPNLNGYSPESLEQAYLNTKAQAAKRHTVRLSGTDISEGKIGLLEEWRDAETPVCIAIAGDLNMRWEEPVPITDLLTYKPRISEGNQAFGVELMVEGRNKKVWYVENLLSPLGWEDADNDNDNEADGYTVQTSDAASLSFNVNDVQEFSVSASSSSKGIVAEITFPISGVEVTTSSVITDIGTLPVGASINIIDFSSSSLSSVDGSAQLSNFETSKANIVLPSNTYTIRAIPIAALGGHTAFVFAGRYPALTTNGTLTPGTSFLGY